MSSLLGKTQNSSGGCLGVQFEPVGRAAAAGKFERADNLNVLLHLFLDG